MNLKSAIWKSTFVLSILVFVKVMIAQTPVITVQFANPQNDCAVQEYCLDVEFKSSLPDQEIFGVNVRFFYDDDVLEFIDLRDYQGEYGPAAPDPPIVITSADAGPDLFNFVGAAEFINGAVQLSGNGPPIILETDSWTKLFQICFTVENLEANLDTFCPALVWDLEQDPANGGFLAGDDGVVITVVDPDPNNESLPADENVVQFNWEYIGDGPPPFGQPVDLTCSNVNCALPLNALTLFGSGENGIHKLQWIDNHELESSGYNVQRSGNALDWSSLGFVPNKVSTNETVPYLYIDKEPLWGYNYYRLEQLATDGQTRFSQIIQITRALNAMEPELRLYPNPVAQGDVMIDFQDDLRSEMTVRVFDPTGKIIENAIFHDSDRNLDVSSLKSGIYFVLVTTTSCQKVAKLIVQ